jgi:hypothetical protein
VLLADPAPVHVSV